MKKDAVAVWVVAAAVLAAVIVVIRQQANTVNGGSADSIARGAAELERVVALTPPTGCDGVAWGTPTVLVGEKGVITRLLRVVSEAAKSPLVAGLLAANPTAADFLDPAKAEAKMRAEAEKGLGFDPFKFGRVAFALCREGSAAFISRAAVAKAGVEIADGRPVGEFVVVSKSKTLRDSIGAWSESEKKVAPPAIAALREVRGVRNGFGGEAFGVIAFGGGAFKRQPRFRTMFAAIETTAKGFRVQAGGSGDEATLATYETKAKEGIATTREMMDRLPAQAMEGMAIAGGADKFKKMIDGLTIKREAGFLTGALSLDIDDVAPIGVVTAVAIPAFMNMKYIRRAKEAKSRWTGTDGAVRDGSPTGVGPADSAAAAAAVVITDARALHLATDKLVTLKGVVENSKIATLLGVDVESFSPDLRGEMAVATGILRKVSVSRKEIDDRIAKFGQFAHRGAGTFYSLVDPTTGRLAQVKRP